MTPAGGRENERGWRSNFATTDALAVRLDTLRRFYRPKGPFGLEVLACGDVDGKRVLEIGPGNGVHAARLLDRTRAVPARWVLLDRSEAMVRAARSALDGRAGALPGVVADAARLPLAPDARFDLAIAMHVLPFVRRPRGVIRAVADRLTMRGKLVITVSGAVDLLTVRQVVRGVVRGRGLPWRACASIGYASGACARDLRAVFGRVVVHEQRGALEFPDVATAERYVASMAWLAPFDAATRREALRAVRSVAERSFERTGRFDVEKASVTFVASALRR
jgi:SAM-dependent methyltransferase